jgi:two-component system response regulator PilR (NtrC family)
MSCSRTRSDRSRTPTISIAIRQVFRRLRQAAQRDVRLVSASHRDLKALVAAGRMREDFYYRIKVFEIAMPALRDRREDIPALANHFAAELARAAGKPHIAIAADALRALLNHP